MRDGIFITATPQPLMSPTTVPMRMPMKNAKNQFFPSWSMVPTTAATRPRLEPTDTSISPIKMAKAMATAMSM